MRAWVTPTGNAINVNPKGRLAPPLSLRSAAKEKISACQLRARGQKCTSGKKFPNTRRCVFVLLSQVLESHQENNACYDKFASGQRIYAYVDGNPVSFSDPLGLQSFPIFPPLPPGTVAQGMTCAQNPAMCACPPERCTNPVTIHFGPKYDEYLGERRPIPQETGTYDGTCLATLGLIGKGVGVAVGNAVANQAIGVGEAASMGATGANNVTVAIRQKIGRAHV